MQVSSADNNIYMNEYRVAGQKLAAMAYGCSDGDVAMASGLIDTLMDPDQPGYGNLQRVLCKYAAEAFKEAGEMASFEYGLYKEASQVSDWYPELDEISNPVLTALGRVYAEAQKDQARVSLDAVKEAALNNIWPTIAGGVVRNTPEVIKNIATLGVGAGAGLGSLMWMMNRHSNTDEKELEAMKAKVKYYRSLTDEIKRELGSGPVTEDTLAEAARNVI
jgi:hypothetical protein